MVVVLGGNMTMTDDNNRSDYNSTISLPEHIEYPFFAYGFFKSDELAYYKIKRFVEVVSKPVLVDGLLYEKDGLPIFTNKQQDDAKECYPVEGELITFQNSEKAYKEIIKIEPGKLYCWDVVDVYCNDEKKKANVLVACDNLFSKENTVSGAIKLKHIDNQLVCDRGVAWRGYRDILFTKGMEFLEKKYFNKPYRFVFNKSNADKNETLYKLFSLQMAYAFLWTIIDRHNTIKYRVNSENLKKTREEMAKDPLYRAAIDRIGNGFVFDYPGIYASSSGNLRLFEGAQNNPIDGYYKKIEMYYLVRCNVVHRGKAGLDTTDFPKLRGAYLDMFAIMQYMLRNELKKSFDIKHLDKDYEYTEDDMINGIEKLKYYKQKYKERD